MLTKVILEGPMGKALGREWEFLIATPSEALKMLDANGIPVYQWIRSNIKKYERYQVICEYEDGTTEALLQEDYAAGIEKKCRVIRFVPLLEGAGNVARIIIGIVLIIVGVIFWGVGGGYLIAIGAGMLIGGVIGMMTKPPGKQSASGGESSVGKSSYYFDGASNTVGQGNPVQLIYGRMRVGSHTIAATNTVDQLM